MRLHPAACALLFLPAGCAVSTGIVPIGPDTYSASEMRAPVLGGGPEARRFVLAETSEFCRRQNRVFIPLELRPDGDPRTPYFPTAFDATFQCLQPGNPKIAAFRAEHPEAPWQ